MRNSSKTRRLAALGVLFAVVPACAAWEDVSGIPTTSLGGNAAHGGSNLGGASGAGGTLNDVRGGASSAGAPSGGAFGSGGAINATGGAKSQGGASNSGAPAGGTAAGGTAAGGASSAGSSSAGASSAGASGVSMCNFASGLNIAWVSFANDVPNPNLTAFDTIFKNTHDAGGSVIRWWFHTNGSKTPGYDGNGLSMKLQQSHIDGVKAILSSAQAHGVRVVVSLWSFDMLQSNAGSAYTNNKLLLENDANRQAYIDNYLTPLVNAIKGHPGLYSWEIFNEPEGMGPKGWSTYRTSEAAIQRTVNWLTAAIHTADPKALVTNGAVTFDYSSNVGGKRNLYSDSALRAAGGKENGVLDYYQVHYYSQNGASNSPFTHPASYWKLDKKLVMGEFFAITTDGVSADALYTNLYTSGYNGAWAWSYNADQKWPTMQAPMQALISSHADVGDCQ